MANESIVLYMCAGKVLMDTLVGRLGYQCNLSGVGKKKKKKIDGATSQLVVECVKVCITNFCRIELQKLLKN